MLLPRILFSKAYTQYVQTFYVSNRIIINVNEKQIMITYPFATNM